MDTIIKELIGLIAAFITSIGFLPQIIKGFKTKKLDDISYFMPVVLAIGMTLWLVYGILINSIAVITANIFSISCSISLIIMKKIYS